MVDIVSPKTRFVCDHSVFVGGKASCPANLLLRLSSEQDSLMQNLALASRRDLKFLTLSCNIF